MSCKAFITVNEISRREMKRKLGPILGSEWKCFTIQQAFAGLQFDTVIIHEHRFMCHTNGFDRMAQLLDVVRGRMTKDNTHNFVIL